MKSVWIKTLSLVLVLALIAVWIPLGMVQAAGDDDDDEDIGIVVTSSFTDLNFRAYVYQLIGKSPGTPIYDIDLIEIDGINCANRQIKSLNGIWHFPNLQYLDCRENQLTTLDMSLNPMLDYLDCWRNQLVLLDVSNNPNLK